MVKPLKCFLEDFQRCTNGLYHNYKKPIEVILEAFRRIYKLIFMCYNINYSRKTCNEYHAIEKDINSIY